jgi:hypothetical protein
MKIEVYNFVLKYNFFTGITAESTQFGINENLQDFCLKLGA